MTADFATIQPNRTRQRRVRRIAALTAVAAIPITALLPGGHDVVEARAGTVTPLFDSGLVVENSSGVADVGVVEYGYGPALRGAAALPTGHPIAGSPLVVRG